MFDFRVNQDDCQMASILKVDEIQYHFYWWAYPSFNCLRSFIVATDKAGIVCDNKTVFQTSEILVKK